MGDRGDLHVPVPHHIPGHTQTCLSHASFFGCSRQQHVSQLLHGTGNTRGYRGADQGDDAHSDKNRKDRVNKEKESSVHAASKKQKTQACLNFTSRSGGAAVASLVVASTQSDPASWAAEVSMEEVIRVELDTYQLKAMTFKLPDPNSAQVHEVCTLEELDEWWA